MLADFFTKYLQGELILKLCETIMVCKNIYALYMGPPSTKERAGNMGEFDPNK